MSAWKPTGLRTAFKDLAPPLFTREGDESPVLYVYVPQFQIDQDPDLEWAGDDLWRRNDDAEDLPDDPGNGFMVPMTHWDQHVIDGQLRA